MHQTSRRDLLRNGALLGAGAFTGNVPPVSAAVNGNTELQGGKWDDEYDSDVEQFQEIINDFGTIVFWGLVIAGVGALAVLLLIALIVL